MTNLNQPEFDFGFYDNINDNNDNNNNLNLTLILILIWRCVYLVYAKLGGSFFLDFFFALCVISVYFYVYVFRC